MPAKRLLRPDRLRQLHAQFSWIDQRLVRDGHVGHGNAHALALYMMLVTVADLRGLSYYGNASIGRLLSMPQEQLERARADLIRVGLIAHQQPLYQGLSLHPPVPPRVSGVHSVQTLLSQRMPLVQRRP